MANGTCVGGVCSPSAGSSSWYDIIQQNPQIYDPSYKWYEDPKYGVSASAASTIKGLGQSLAIGCAECDEIQQQISEMQQLKTQFPGSEATYIRWLIDNKVRSLQNTLDELRASNVSTGMALREASGSAKLKAQEMERLGFIGSGSVMRPQPNIQSMARGFEQTSEEYQPLRTSTSDVAGFTPEPPPVPDWLLPYLEPSITAEGTQPQGRGWLPGAEGRTPTLRPLGAQAELDPEQLGLMAGYGAWTAAGAPYEYSQANITEMADWQKSWLPHTRLSESLFPKQTRLGARWMPTRQR